MHRIDGQGATDDNRFTEGDPTSGISATMVTADFMNAIQEEFAAVIEGAGITLNKESNAQLKDALEIMLAQWTPDASETVAGIVKLATEALALAGEDDTTAMTPALVKAVVDANSPSEALESYRLSRIGTAHAMAGTTLPSGYMWGDGTLVYFEDYPELEEAHANGQLLVLSSDSTADEQAALPMAFVERSDGTGLYLPRLSGLFARAWTGEDDGTVGGYNTAGVPDVTGTINAAGGISWGGTSGAFSRSSGTAGQVSGSTTIVSGSVLYMYASNANSTYGNSDTVMPESYNQPCAIYLGQPTISTEAEEESSNDDTV